MSGDTPVEGIERFARFENAVEVMQPVAFPGIGHAKTGNVLSVAVDELEEEEAVEKPVLAAVGKRMRDIRHELFRRPVRAVASPLIDQSKIAYLLIE